MQTSITKSKPYASRRATGKQIHTKTGSASRVGILPWSAKEISQLRNAASSPRRLENFIKTSKRSRRAVVAKARRVGITLSHSR